MAKKTRGRRWTAAPRRGNADDMDDSSTNNSRGPYCDGGEGRRGESGKGRREKGCHPLLLLYLFFVKALIKSRYSVDSDSSLHIILDCLHGIGAAGSARRRPSASPRLYYSTQNWSPKLLPRGFVRRGPLARPGPAPRRARPARCTEQEKKKTQQ
ncbi:hypothetical protein EVAR_28112_1 [Eumeta japonica]|uniref:Uncharacterized protein n=1 Tax=Eumeta variegata TaxID=151549 RepID=A0A4C1VD46_EUMVA|nr:hypothetical protein EVAR_28112_1 [Eumeta japonica]